MPLISLDAACEDSSYTPHSKLPILVQENAAFSWMETAKYDVF